MKVKVTYNKDANELWSDVFGSLGGFLDHSWLHSIHYYTGAADRHGLVELTIDNPAPEFDEEAIHMTKRLKVEDLATAYSKLMNDNYTHCGGCELDDPDACTADAILQVAVYGELVYG